MISGYFFAMLIVQMSIEYTRKIIKACNQIEAWNVTILQF